jgi:hypothetical protein
MQVTPYRRDKFLKLLDGVTPLSFTFFYWNSMVECDRILDWCFKQNLKGQKLFQWLEENFPKSPLGSAQFILKKCGEDRQILYGRDFR